MHVNSSVVCWHWPLTSFGPLCRYVRTDSCFWHISWELCGTSLTSCLTTFTWTHKSPTSCFSLNQQISPWLPLTQHFSIPLPTTFKTLARPACSLCFPERGKTGHLKRFLTSPPCMTTSVCCTGSLLFPHTPLERKDWTLMIRFHTQRTEVFVPQVFAAAGNLHSFPVNNTVPSKVTIECEAAFSFMSPQCHHKPLPGIFNGRHSYLVCGRMIDAAVTCCPQISRSKEMWIWGKADSKNLRKVKIVLQPGSITGA